MIILRIAALSFGIVALAACSQEEAKAPVAPPVEIAPAVAGQTGSAQAIGCMTYLSLRQAALEDQTPPGDASVVRTALNDWEEAALQTMTDDDLAMQYVSAIAVAGRADPAVVTATADWCVTNKPA